MRWTLPITASMRQNSSFNPTIYIGSIQDEPRAIGIDLAKNVFQVCGVNEHMKPESAGSGS
jgi:hypothetical protein